MANWNKSQLKTQFNRAVKLGWLPFFENAAETITKGYFDTADLLAIGSRETNLDPKWLTKAGDGGNGFGLMQADKRSFPEFTRGDGWKDAETGIKFGAKVLMQKWTDYENNIGKPLTVKSSKGQTYRYTAKKADGQAAQHLVLSGYNCGRWSQYAFAKGQDIDKYSTGKDYGADVMKRAAVFRSLLNNIGAAPTESQVLARTPVLPSDNPSVSSEQAAPTNQDASAENLAAIGGEQIGGFIESAKTEAKEKLNAAFEQGANDAKSQAIDYVTTKLPNFQKTGHWLKGLTGFGSLGFLISYFEGLPWYVMFFFGYMAGVASTALVVFFLIKTHYLGWVTKKVAEANADPNQNNIELVQLPPAPGIFTRLFNRIFRRDCADLSIGVK